MNNLPNDSIIVQIPYVGGNACNRLERLLSVFDQSRCIKSNDHLLESKHSKKYTLHALWFDCNFAPA